MEDSQSIFVEQRPARPRCFLDFNIASPNNTSDNQTHRIIIELYADICPLTCENFRCLCTGEKGVSPVTNKPLHYKGSSIHRIVKNFMVQGGDTILSNGKSGESIYGKTFPDENFEIKHDKPYMLSMANKGKDTNSSQFFITTVPASHLDGVHVAFGHVISGQAAIRLMEEIPTDETYKPTFPITITKSGELVLQIKKRTPLPPTTQVEKDIGENEGSGESSGSSSDEPGLYDEGEITADTTADVATSGKETGKTLPPDIPRNYLLRRYDTTTESAVGDQAALTNGRNQGETEGLPPWQVFDESAIEMARLRAMMSQHLPNPEAIGGTGPGPRAQPSGPSNGGRPLGTLNQEERWPSDKFTDDRNHRPDPRRSDNDTVYRHLQTYYEDRKRKNNNQGALQEEPRGHEGVRKSGRSGRIPAHILRKLKRSSTPPHWKDAQRRLVKLEDLVKPGKPGRAIQSPEFEELKKDQENNYMINLKLERGEVEDKHPRGKPSRAFPSGRGKDFWSHKQPPPSRSGALGGHKGDDSVLKEGGHHQPFPNLKSSVKIAKSDQQAVQPPAAPNPKPVERHRSPGRKRPTSRSEVERTKGAKRRSSRSPRGRGDRHHHHSHKHSGHKHGHARDSSRPRRNHAKSTRTKYTEEKGRRAASIASSSSSSSTNATDAPTKPHHKPTHDATTNPITAAPLKT